jgi:UDP-glucose 4-epimerase
VLKQGESGHAYNIGTGVGRSNLDVLRDLEPFAARAGCAVRTELLPARRFDVPANVLEARKLSEVSGWRPQVAFAAGLERAWRAAFESYKK